ncbi:hypothetical protein [Streptomyces silvensis]|uniref:Uncharacterized protein n=1 Tax=Streptomyces silvensis TaxID=1765722 RepID=A0A0W7X820_9ACTN|nr:hypothetical protein [Streptomyces silvensis]KUF18944.1 hypothetical protein AT728_07965 [Streptomyces silvensis]
MTHLATGRPDGHPDPHAHAYPTTAPTQSARVVRAARARQWATAALIALLTLLLGGATPAAATTPAPATALPLVAPDTTPAAEETKERALRDGEVLHAPRHFTRNRPRVPAARGGAAPVWALSLTLCRPDPRIDPEPGCLRPGTADPRRAGACLLILLCVSRS